MKHEKLVYICSPLKGDVEKNILRAKRYCRFAYSKGFIPIAPHIIFTSFLDDDNQDERQDGMQMGLKLLLKCHEIWVFGDVVSEGMAIEIKIAKNYRIPIRRFNAFCEEVEGDILC